MTARPQGRTSDQAQVDYFLRELSTYDVYEKASIQFYFQCSEVVSLVSCIGRIPGLFENNHRIAAPRTSHIGLGLNLPRSVPRVVVFLCDAYAGMTQKH